MTDNRHCQHQQQQQQQFCLRWNNFQANITSQFEALRDDEDFVDVTFACEGKRLQAHKVVLSACSPYFKELFKTNPCKHPIIFMRDVEFEHLQALLEFMYAGEVNISQAELPTFLRTAESLQIRGLTECHTNQQKKDIVKSANNASNGREIDSINVDDDRSRTPLSSSPPPLKRLCKQSDSPRNSSPGPSVTCASNTQRSRPVIEPQVQLDCYKDMSIVQPKLEIPEYGSDEDSKAEVHPLSGGYLNVDGGMDVRPSYSQSYSRTNIESGLPGPSHMNLDLIPDQSDPPKLHSLDPRPCPVCNRIYSNLSNLRQHIRLIHNPQSVSCPLCNKLFKTKLYLKRHLVSFHDLAIAAPRQSVINMQEEIYQQQLKMQHIQVNHHKELILSSQHGTTDISLGDSEEHNLELLSLAVPISSKMVETPDFQFDSSFHLSYTNEQEESSKSISFGTDYSQDQDTNQKNSGNAVLECRANSLTEDLSKTTIASCNFADCKVIDCKNVPVQYNASFQ